MARQKGVLPFTGPLGDRVGYRRNGEYFLRRKALQVRQSAATKLAAKDFGSASRGGAQLRHALHAELLRHYDSDLITRLNKALTGIIRNDHYRAAGERRLHVSNMQGLCGFRFNGNGCHQNLLSCTPDITADVQGKIQLSLSDLRPNAPKGVTHLTIKAIVVSANFERNAMEVASSATVNVANRRRCNAITLTIDPVQGICAARKGMRIVLIEVQPHIQVNGQLLPSGNKQGYALDVIAVLPPVEQFVKVRHVHSNKAPMLKIIPRYENRNAQRASSIPFVIGHVDLELLSLLIDDH